MLEYLSQAITSLTAAKNIATTLLELRDFDKLTTATIELKGHLVQTYDHIISEKERVLTLQAKISELEKECIRLKDWSTEKEQYTRKQIANGVFAYIENNFKGDFQGAHKLCCNCFNKTVKSTLQQGIKRTHIRLITLVCPNGCPELEFISYIS
jgi:hypothetical protein